MLVAAMAAGAILMGSLQTADTFWANQGHPDHCPDAWSVQDLGGPEVRAEAGIGWCGGLIFDTQTVEIVGQIRYMDRMAARTELKNICLISTHERGHEAQPFDYKGVDGEGHESSGIMQAFLDGVKPPAVCVEWAVKLTRKARKKR